jgi:hypothetical protein
MELAAEFTRASWCRQATALAGIAISASLWRLVTKGRADLFTRGQPILETNILCL